MKPGTPFETKALDEQRSEQRQALRMVPGWLLQEFAPQHAVSDSSSDSALLEAELRREADRLRERLRQSELGDLPKRMEQETRTEVLIEFLREHDVRAQIGPGTVPARLFSRRVTELDAELSRVAIPEEPKGDDSVALRSYIHMLVWADDLAGDEYSDPRLADLDRQG